MAASTKLPCPHCGSDAAGFTVMHWYEHASGGNRCAMQCGVCDEAIIASYPLMKEVLTWLQGPSSVLPIGLKPDVIWPKARSDVTPGNVPPNVASLYTQAMASLRRQHYDAAGPLFRRIMEVSLKVLHPEGKGSLYERIEGLPEDKGVTPAMKQWAHAVRLIGRDAAHDEGLVTKEEAEDMQAFVELF